MRESEGVVTLLTALFSCQEKVSDFGFWERNQVTDATLSPRVSDLIKHSRQSKAILAGPAVFLVFGKV
jgi:hypothetical protein